MYGDITIPLKVSVIIPIMTDYVLIASLLPVAHLTSETRHTVLSDGEG